MSANAADRKQIRHLEKQAKLADAQRRAVITSLMSTTFGREWMWDKLSECHMFVTTFNGDALQSAFMEGQRAIGLSMLSDIMIACPDQYIQAMRESNERSSLDERRSSPVDDGGDPGSAADDPSDDDTDSITYAEYAESGRFGEAR
jgi:hypothetical protein